MSDDDKKGKGEEIWPRPRRYDEYITPRGQIVRIPIPDNIPPSNLTPEEERELDEKARKIIDYYKKEKERREKEGEWPSVKNPDVKDP